MTDIEKLKVLAEAATQGATHVDFYEGDARDDFIGSYEVLVDPCEGYYASVNDIHERAKADADFIAAANPAAVMELIAEIERQSSQFKEWQASHHANYCAIADERDQLKAENKRLKTEAECAVAKQNHAEMIGDGFYHASENLKAENDALRKDAERYRWLRGDTSAGKVDFCIMRKHWRRDALSEVLTLEEADQQIDAAMSKEPSHD